MEPCPNCGQLTRVGAKFCTICGERMAGNGSAAVEQGAVSTSSSSRFGESRHTEVIGSWPAPVQANEPASTEAAADLVWAPPPSPAGEAPPASTGSNAAEDEGRTEEFASVWSGANGSSWPAPASNEDGEPVGVDVDPEPAAPAAPEVLVAELTPVQEDSNAEGSAELETDQADPPVAEPRERIARLMDELRDSIASIGRRDALDLTSVIAELEIAVTPPGAIRPEELAELRKALLAAREHPREIDTMIDLSGRINAMMALTIAYDRAIAAIERSLEVLRRI